MISRETRDRFVQSNRFSNLGAEEEDAGDKSDRMDLVPEKKRTDSAPIPVENPLFVAGDGVRGEEGDVAMHEVHVQEGVGPSKPALVSGGPLR